MSCWGSLRKTAYLLLPLLIYFVIHDVLQILLLAVTEQFLQRGGIAADLISEHAATVKGLVSGLSVLGGVAVLWKAAESEIGAEDDTGRWKRQESEVVKRNVLWTRVEKYILSAVLAFCFSMGLNIVFYQTGFSGSSESYEAVYELQYGVKFVIGVILYGLVSPLAEEIIFRGLLFQRMKRCFNYRIALIVSSLLFGFYHGNVVQAVYGTALGLVIAWSYELFGDFMVPLLFHAVANISVYTMTYGNRLSEMKRQNALITAIILLAIGGYLLFWLQMKQNRNQKKE